MGKRSKTQIKTEESTESSDAPQPQNTLRKKIKKDNSESAAGTSEMSTYNKQHIIKILKDINCNPDLEDMLLLNFNRSSNKTLDDCKEFIAQESLKWQNRITNEYKDPKFKSANKTVEYLDRIGVKNQCTFDISLILQTIANAESHPSVDELNGIDLKKLYLILANLSRGVPIDDESINEETKNFLLECFAELIEKVENEESNLIPKLQKAFDEQKDSTSKPKNNGNELKTKIELANGINETIDEALMDEIINPLQIPTIFLVEENTNKEK